VTLSALQRSLLCELAGVLIPGDGVMPSAVEVGVHEDLVDRVMAVRPRAARELADLLDRLLAEPASGTPGRRLVALRNDRPADFTLLASFVTGAYFLDERARASIGYPGQGPTDTTFHDETGYVTEGLLDPVIERGPRIR
jgi:hypothetical protein